MKEELKRDTEYEAESFCDEMTGLQSEEIINAAREAQKKVDGIIGVLKERYPEGSLYDIPAL